MSSISAVSPIPSAILTTPVQAIRPVAPKTAAPSSGFDSGEASGAAGRVRSANPPGVGEHVDITA